MTTVYRDQCNMRIELLVPPSTSQDKMDAFMRDTFKRKDMSFCQAILANTAWDYAGRGLSMENSHVCEVEGYQLKIKIHASSNFTTHYLGNKLITSDVDVDWEAQFPQGKFENMPFDHVVDLIHKSTLNSAQKIIAIIYHSINRKHFITPSVLEIDQDKFLLYTKKLEINDQDTILTLMFSSRKYSQLDDDRFRHNGKLPPHYEYPEEINFPEGLIEKYRTILNGLQDQAQLEKANLPFDQVIEVVKDIQPDSLQQIINKQKKLLETLKVVRENDVDGGEYQKTIKEFETLIQKSEKINTDIRKVLNKSLSKNKDSKEHRAFISKALHMLEKHE